MIDPNVSQPKGMGWTKERDEVLRRLFQQKLTARAIGKAMNLHHAAIVRRIKTLGLRLEAGPVERVKPSHISRYKEVRRGFSVPEHLEREYYDLLKTGVPIAEARRRLGI